MNRAVHPAATLLMIRPAQFYCDGETAEDNTFQDTSTALSPSEASLRAQAEFDGLVETLKQHDIALKVFQCPTDRETPNAVYPNNWFSTHLDQTLVLYPMRSPRRRKEKAEPMVSWLKERADGVIDFSEWEGRGKFLEGTGALVLDRLNKIAYACRSQRMHQEVLREWSEALGFRTVCFEVDTPQGDPVYHTNVVMALGRRLCILYADGITDEQERQQVFSALKSTNHEVLLISWEQVEAFCGNLLEVTNKNGQPCWLMSSRAYHAFTNEQRSLICSHGTIVHAPVPTIEEVGGGGVRCMLGEVFLKESSD